MLKISIAQMNPTVGEFSGILKSFQESFEAAQSSGAHLVVTPELSLCGYFPGDYLGNAQFAQAVEAAEQTLWAMSRQFPEIHMVYGLPAPTLFAGKDFTNTLRVLKNGKVVLDYAKQLLPQYNVFDEARYFEPGKEAAVLDIEGVKVGFLVCEDAWSHSTTQYHVHPLAQLAKQNAQLVVSINASPSNINKRTIKHELFEANANRYGIPIVYVNQVGGQDSLVFDGASFVVEPGRGVTAELKRFVTGQTTIAFANGIFEFDAKCPSMARKGENEMSPSEYYLQQITLGLRDYMRRCGFKKALVGSSGGIDSALTLAIAALALGPDNVQAITMPSAYSSSGSVSDSQALCTNLGVELFNFPIGQGVDWVKSASESAMGYAPKGLALENLQARIRGTLLMTHSNTSGALLLTTGNKSEVSVGYCTLYGDTSGGLNLIGDLYKTEVFELARHINKVHQAEIIPNAIIEKEPSAELAPDQKDSDSLPPYDVLDMFLKQIIESSSLSRLEQEEINAWNAQEKANDAQSYIQTYNRVVQLVARSEYKRKQAAPIIRVRALAFGSGRRMPLAVNTDWLKLTVSENQQ